MAPAHSAKPLGKWTVPSSRDIKRGRSSVVRLSHSLVYIACCQSTANECGAWSAQHTAALNADTGMRLALYSYFFFCGRGVMYTAPARSPVEKAHGGSL